MVRTQLTTMDPAPGAHDCVVYNYYSSVSNPTSCTVPSQGTGDNGNVMGYFFQDSTATPTPSVGHTASYTYDALNRLATSAATGSQTHNLTFSSDRYGNLTCVTNGSTNGPCGNWTFNAANNRITNTAFSYDAAGNLTADGTGFGTHTFGWDAENRLASVDGGTAVGYTYNALGQRVEKNVGGSLTEYFYNAFGQVIYTHNGTTVMADYFPLGASGFTFAKRYGSGARFMHANALGSVGVVTDYAGATQQDEIYYPWGGRWSVVGNTSSEQFASLQERDAETTTWQDPLDPSPNRTYTSGLGRWLSPDPLAGSILNPQSLNRYAYVLNNPINLIDPLGLKCVTLDDGSVGDDGTEPFCSQVSGAGDSANVFGTSIPLDPDFQGFSEAFDLALAEAISYISTNQNQAGGGGASGSKPGSKQPDKPGKDPENPVASEYCQEHGQFAFNIPFTKTEVAFSLSASALFSYSTTNDLSLTLPPSGGVSLDMTIGAPKGPNIPVSVGIGKNNSVGTFITPKGPRGFSLSIPPYVPTFGAPITVSPPILNTCGIQGGG